jgi:hypothetical protein
MEHNSAPLGGVPMTHHGRAYFAVVGMAIACTNLWPVSASGPELVKLSVTSLGGDTVSLK